MLKIALIGTGFMGEIHLQVWQEMDNAQITAVCTSTPEKGACIARRYNCAHYQSLETLLSCEDIDIVDICTPTFLHEKNIMMAASFKKHILCEKPLTLSLDSMDRIMSKVKETGIYLMTGHVLRFWAEYVAIKELYESGAIGKVHGVYTHRLAQYPPNTSWRHNSENSGGGLFDLTLHDVDFLIYLLGEVETLYATGFKSDSGCWDHVSVLLTFKNGVNATVEGVLGMTDGYPFSAALRIIGEQGTVDFDMSSGVNIENLDKARSSVIFYQGDHPPKLLNPAAGRTNFDAELRYFASCVESHTFPSKVPLSEVRYSFEILLAIQKSLETGQLIKLLT